MAGSTTIGKKSPADILMVVHQLDAFSDYTKAIHTARLGSYPEIITADVSQQRRSRFFNRRDSRYQIKKNIRDNIIFSTHNLINDPPVFQYRSDQLPQPVDLPPRGIRPTRSAHRPEFRNSSVFWMHRPIALVDITELRQIPTLRRITAVFENASDAVTMQDFEGNVLSWDRSAERLYSWTEKEATQIHITEIIAEKNRH